MAFATFLVWWLRTGACGFGACGFWRYRMSPTRSNERWNLKNPTFLKLRCVLLQSTRNSPIRRRFLNRDTACVSRGQGKISMLFVRAQIWAYSPFIVFLSKARRFFLRWCFGDSGDKQVAYMHTPNGKD